MTTLPLKLEDLAPKETSFTLSTQPGKTFTLCRFSLRVRAWASEKHGGAQGLKGIFETQKILEIADIAFFMLKEKEAFASQDDFLDAIVTVGDQVQVVKALLGAVGIGEPELKAIEEHVSKAGALAPNP